MSKSIEIQVPILARVEGEGALELVIEDNQLKSVELKIYEPPRLFEKFLEQRSYQEVLDIVARICGICPVAYQMSATQAIEQCLDVKITPWIREMRRLFYCGEWIESHSLHVHLLAAPDFFGFKSATDMAKVYPEEVKRGLRLQGFGNKLIKLLGGRSVHPVGACVGGFYKAPDLNAVDDLLQEAKRSLKDCEALLVWLAGIKLPQHEHPFPSVSLYHPNEYPMNEGKIVSNQGLKLDKEAFDSQFQEFQVPYSTALHCLLQGKPYLVGPLARVNNNLGHLPAEMQLLLQTLGIKFPSQNLYHSILARAAEIYYCVLEAIRIMHQYYLPDASRVEVNPKAGQGFGCTEAPRGLLWQHYRFDEKGLVTFARIVPPTSQNQARIEEDLRVSLPEYGLDKSIDDLRQYSEMIIRNYDPCISCSTHFLNLTVKNS